MMTTVTLQRIKNKQLRKLQYMARSRVGTYQSLVMDLGYVIQKKVWWGWRNWAHYDEFNEAGAIEDAKWLEKQGHEVEWYI